MGVAGLFAFLRGKYPLIVEQCQQQPAEEGDEAEEEAEEGGLCDNLYIGEALLGVGLRGRRGRSDCSRLNCGPPVEGGIRAAVAPPLKLPPARPPRPPHAPARVRRLQPPHPRLHAPRLAGPAPHGGGRDVSGRQGHTGGLSRKKGSVAWQAGQEASSSAHSWRAA